jgi:hypothetical protein
MAMGPEGSGSALSGETSLTESSLRESFFLREVVERSRRVEIPEESAKMSIGGHDEGGRVRRGSRSSECCSYNANKGMCS